MPESTPAYLRKNALLAPRFSVIIVISAKNPESNEELFIMHNTSEKTQPLDLYLTQ